MSVRVANPDNSKKDEETISFCLDTVTMSAALSATLKLTDWHQSD